MFILNKWYTIYNKIILNAQQRGLDKSQVVYDTEIHHIIPRSMGGDNASSNLVLLSLKEHFVCHHLLTKCVGGQYAYKVRHAFAQMVHCGKYSPTARQYATARKLYSESKRSLEWRANISKANKGKKRTKEYVNAMKQRLTGRKLSDSHRQNVALASARRGVHPHCRAARLETLIKPFRVTFPNGVQIEGVNLKQFCIDNNIHYPSAATNSKTNKPVSRGPLKGFNFELFR